MLVREALRHAAEAARILGVDTDRAHGWAAMLDRLPPYRVGRFGQLQEWREDFEEVEPGHRHYSHLIGLYPGDEILPDQTPALWDAARRSLERRLAHKGGHTGWSRSWTACLFARLGDAASAWEHLVHLILDFATDSLLDLHPPRIFQIDGNFGGAAAVLEMLLQSYRQELHFLPALPVAWPEGRVSGLRARGGFQVDICWSKGRLTSAGILSVTTRECVVRRGPCDYRVCDESGNPVCIQRDDRTIRFPVQAGKRYELRPGEE
jgi:alpha-L-fucosidase 2